MLEKVRPWKRFKDKQLRYRYYKELKECTCTYEERLRILDLSTLVYGRKKRSDVTTQVLCAQKTANLRLQHGLRVIYVCKQKNCIVRKLSQAFESLGQLQTYVNIFLGSTMSVKYMWV